MATFTVSILVLILSSLAYGSNLTRKHESRNGGYQIGGYLTPQVTPVCSLFCADGATWAIRLPRNDVDLIFDQESLGYTYLDDKTAVIAYMGDDAVLVVKKDSLMTVQIYETSASFNQIPIDADNQKAIEMLANPAARLSAIRILKKVYNKNIRFDDTNVLATTGVNYIAESMSNLSPMIRKALATFMQTRLARRVPYMNGAMTFSTSFNLMSLLEGDLTGMITTLAMSKDYSINVVAAQQAAFIITDSGKVIQNGVSGCSLNLEQIGVLPGNIKVSDKSTFIYEYYPLVTQPSCSSQSLANDVGTTLLVYPEMNPIVALLKRIRPLIFGSM